MFDCDISLFMLISIAIYFDFSHISIESLFMLNSNKCIVWFWYFIVYVKHV